MPSEETYKQAINSGTFPADLPLVKVARLARAAGFSALEPVLAAEGELTFTTEQPACVALGDAIRAAGVAVSAVAVPLFRNLPFTSPNADERARACALAEAALDRARWLGAPLVIVAAGVVGEWNVSRPLVRYEDALQHAHRAFQTLAFAAEARNVMLAVENAWTRFLQSPVEMRALIDHVNSAWLRVCLNVGYTLAVGYPEDWIETLGPRILSVRASDYRLASGTPAGLCLPGEGDVDWPGVLTALRQCHYAGPITYEGPGDPAEISRRLDRMLAG